MKKFGVLVILLLIVSLYSVQALNVPTPPPSPGQESGSTQQSTQDTNQNTDNQAVQQDTTTTQTNSQTTSPSIPSTNSVPTSAPAPTTTSNSELNSCKSQLVQCQNELTKAQTVFPQQVVETKTGSIITFLIVVLIVAIVISVWILHKRKEFGKRETREKIMDYIYLQMSKGYNRQAIYRALSGREDIDSNMLVDIFKEINSKVNKR